MNKLYCFEVKYQYGNGKVVSRLEWDKGLC